MTEILKEYPEGCCSVSESPRYPWGTSIDLSDKLADASGASSLEVGQELTVTGKVLVTHRFESTDTNGKVTKSVTLQFTNIDLGVTSSGVAQSVLYPRGQ